MFIFSLTRKTLAGWTSPGLGLARLSEVPQLWIGEPPQHGEPDYGNLASWSSSSWLGKLTTASPPPAGSGLCCTNRFPPDFPDNISTPATQFDFYSFRYLLMISAMIFLCWQQNGRIVQMRYVIWGGERNLKLVYKVGTKHSTASILWILEIKF